MEAANQRMIHVLPRRRPRWVWMSIGAAFTAPVCIMFGFIMGRMI